MAGLPTHPHDMRQRAKLDAEVARDKKLAIDLEVQDTVQLMASPDGRRTVYRLFDRANALVFGSAFNANAMTMAYDAGRLDTVSRLRELIVLHCPEQWITMLRENTRNS